MTGKRHHRIYALYSMLFVLLFVIASPLLLVKMFLKGKYWKSFRGRLGRVPRELRDLKGSPRIWVHAVSVGEVNAVSPVVRELKVRYRGACIVLSTGTETGQEMARKNVPEANAIFYCPLDFPWAVSRVLAAIEPDLVITAEAELWPNLLRLAHARGAKTMLVNGRISQHSFRRYLLTKWLWREVLKNLDFACMKEDADARRLAAIGARAETIQVTGNCKFDALAGRRKPSHEDEMRRVLGVPGESQVLVAGSTHRGEEETVLAAYRRLRQLMPDLILVIAPRHPERVQSVEQLMRRGGWSGFVRRSELARRPRKPEERIILLDTIGELSKLYGIASVAFCGGSLVPRGGQNILEPAAWGKVVLYGPSMDDYAEARLLLEKAGAGITVRSAEELSARVLGLMQNRKDLERRGKAGERLLLASRGAAGRCARAAQELLGPRFNPERPAARKP